MREACSDDEERGDTSIHGRVALVYALMPRGAHRSKLHLIVVRVIVGEDRRSAGGGRVANICNDGEELRLATASGGAMGWVARGLPWDGRHEIWVQWAGVG